jgi:hypothetical protein
MLGKQKWRDSGKSFPWISAVQERPSIHYVEIRDPGVSIRVIFNIFTQ